MQNTNTPAAFATTPYPNVANAWRLARAALRNVGATYNTPRSNYTAARAWAAKVVRAARGITRMHGQQWGGSVWLAVAATCNQPA